MEYHGFFMGDDFSSYLLGTIALVLLFGYKGAPLILWSILALAAVFGFGAPEWLMITTAVVVFVLNVKPIRRYVLSVPVMKILSGLGFLPKISATERTALEAGVVWVEADLFSGKPDFNKIMKEPYPQLTAEEQAFIDGPVDKVCEMTNDWEVWQSRQIPENVWKYIRDQKFLGMIIPKEYGGLGFSAMAHSEVIQKLSSRSVPLGVTVMVPNSLGPAELLIHYGTEKQKKDLLPKLATGEHIPCFALTEPQAGSDAGALQSEGILFKKDGKLYVRLTWNKRWITLAAISTILGLAFRLRDPENLLGKGEDLGITCALIPSNTPGVVIGKRHDPLGVPFYNCPTQGKDVVIEMEEYVVGGLEGCGKGWSMLMECLSAGRGISLPAQSAGGAKYFTRVATNHSTIRKQFGLSIGKFEGIEEPLSRIAGMNYAVEAMRRFTLGALDKGIKPPVITAIVKYQATEIQRKMINDTMDILGGAGISNGPRNLVANAYIATPIGITVEGANILTRTLIIFGQGALRAHPYAFLEVNALEKNDIPGFDKAFWGHIGHVIRNVFRTILLSLTRGWISTPKGGLDLGRYYRKLSWISATFATMSDIAMASLGGSLKAKEKITGRFADILSWMYIGTSVLRRYEFDGRRKEDLPYVHYAMKHCLTQIQIAFDGIFANLNVPLLSWLFRGPIRAWSNLNSVGEDLSDDLTHELVKLSLTDCEQRDRLTAGIFIPKNPEDGFAKQENAYKLAKKAESAEKKIRKAVRKKILPKKKAGNLVALAFEKGVIDAEEKRTLEESVQAVWDAIQVDDFTQEEYLNRSLTKPHAFKLVSGK